LPTRLDPIFFRCTLCAGQGTRASLVSALLSDPHFMVQLTDAGGSS
jgi:hypothetical protein